MRITTVLIGSLQVLVKAAGPPFFLLAGDSTTAIQSEGGGGWGNGFLSTTLKPPASGINYGHNGATTVSFRQGGDWATVLGQISRYKGTYTVFVTLQFGHNDQKQGAGISLQQYASNLATFVAEVRAAGGEPILITPLTRRDFDSQSPPRIVQSLANERSATISVAQQTSQQTPTMYIDLNIASENYCNAIGPAASWGYDLKTGDHTHLNDHGSVVFGRLVSDLLVEKYQGIFAEYTNPDAALSQALRDGRPA